MHVQRVWSYHFSAMLPNFIKNDLEKFWRYLGNTRKSVDQIKVNDVFTSDHDDIAQHFNAYFQSVFFLTLILPSTMTILFRTLTLYVIEAFI